MARGAAGVNSGIGTLSLGSFLGLVSELRRRRKCNTQFFVEGNPEARREKKG